MMRYENREWWRIQRHRACKGRLDHWPKTKTTLINFHVLYLIFHIRDRFFFFFLSYSIYDVWKHTFELYSTLVDRRLTALLDRRIIISIHKREHRYRRTLSIILIHVRSSTGRRLFFFFFFSAREWNQTRLWVSKVGIITITVTITVTTFINTVISSQDINRPSNEESGSNLKESKFIF